MIYKRGKHYWYEFEFAGKRYRKSTSWKREAGTEITKGIGERR